MASKSSKAFRLWRKRMGLTQNSAAKALGLGKSTITNYDIGKRSDTESPIIVSRVVLLACSAIEQGLPPISDIQQEQ